MKSVLLRTRGGKGMNCGGHGVGTPLPFRPSLSPRGVAGRLRDDPPPFMPFPPV